jgi:hypothetical protein
VAKRRKKQSDMDLSTWLAEQRGKMYTPPPPLLQRLRWWWWNVAPKAVVQVGSCGAMVSLADMDWKPRHFGSGISWLAFSIWWR